MASAIDFYGTKPTPKKPIGTMPTPTIPSIAPKTPTTNMVRPTGPAPAPPANTSSTSYAGAPAGAPALTGPIPKVMQNIYGGRGSSAGKPPAQVALAPLPSFQQAKEYFETPYDIRNKDIQTKYNPNYKNSQADNTWMNAMKHAGVAAELSRDYSHLGPIISAALPIAGGMIHEYGGIANKYLNRPINEWGQIPKANMGQFGIVKDFQYANMDTQNNIVGSVIGAMNLTPEKQQEMLMWALKNGWLKVLKGPQWDFRGGPRSK